MSEYNFAVCQSVSSTVSSRFSITISTELPPLFVSLHLYVILNANVRFTRLHFISIRSEFSFFKVMNRGKTAGGKNKTAVNPSSDFQVRWQPVCVVQCNRVLKQFGQYFKHQHPVVVFCWSATTTHYVISLRVIVMIGLYVRFREIRIVTKRAIIQITKWYL